jgi:hypothetical protein
MALIERLSRGRAGLKAERTFFLEEGEKVLGRRSWAVTIAGVSTRTRWPVAAEGFWHDNTIVQFLQSKEP